MLLPCHLFVCCIFAMSSSTLHLHVFKTCIHPGLPVLSVVRSEPRHTCTHPRHVRSIILLVARKCSRNGMKVGMRCCYVVSRPPAKFDTPMDNSSGIIVSLTSDVFGLRKLLPGFPYYSGIIVGLTSDVFGLRKLLPGFPSISSLDHLHSPLPTARPRNPSLHSTSTPPRV